MLPLKSTPFRAPLDMADRTAGMIEAITAQGEATTRKTIAR